MLLCVFMLVSLNACSNLLNQPNSGIDGTVLLGPVSPVQKEGEINDKPFPDAVIFIMNSIGGKKVMETVSDRNGHFRVNLSPGVYMLVPQNPKGKMLPFGKPETVTVLEAQFTEITVYYDSGIRGAVSGNASDQPAASESAQPGPSAASGPSATISAASDAPVIHGEPGSVSYENKEYGFRFALPKSWEGYQIITDKWTGFSLIAKNEGEISETGPLLSIRHPAWTSEVPRQDIPILIFSLTQWDALQQEDFHIGAAPIGPSELGRNSRYVFALPARYNYAFPLGFEEVEKTLEGSPLTTFEP